MQICLTFWGLPLKLFWKFLKDSREKLFEILAVVIVLSPIPSVCEGVFDIKYSYGVAYD